MSPWLDFFKQRASPWSSNQSDFFSAYIPEPINDDPKVRVKYPDGSSDVGAVRAWLVRGEFVVAVVEFWNRFEDLPLERLEPEYMS